MWHMTTVHAEAMARRLSWAIAHWQIWVCPATADAAYRMAWERKLRERFTLVWHARLMAGMQRDVRWQ